MDEPPLTAGILGIAPHRVYLVSLQPDCTCFLLHLSCPDFMPGRRALPVMLLCGVRTFLPAVKATERQSGLLILFQTDKNVLLLNYFYQK